MNMLLWEQEEPGDPGEERDEVMAELDRRGLFNPFRMP